MSDRTAIEWADATWSPLVGCRPVSEGCRHCYAARFARRMDGPSMTLPRRPYQGLTWDSENGAVWNGQVRPVPEVFDLPLRWKKPRRIFVCSMGDLFHPAVAAEWIDRVVAVMALAPHHTFQVLTKRPERMQAYLTTPGLYERILQVADHELRPNRRHLGGIGISNPERGWKHLWLGVSCENQAAADARIPHLLATPAALRFVSLEPLLGPIDMSPYLSVGRWMECPCGNRFWSGVADRCYCNPPCGCRSVGECYHSDSWTLACPKCGRCACDRMEKWRRQGRMKKVPGSGFDECLDPAEWFRPISWVIVGGETGPGARPMQPDWVRSVRDQCAAAGVSFFFKSWGDWVPADQVLRPGKSTIGHRVQDGMVRVGKKRAGCLLDGREWKDFPVVEGHCVGMSPRAIRRRPGV